MLKTIMIQLCWRYSFNDGTTDGWLLLTIREDVGLCSISFHRSPINFENLD